ncbi:MAG: hypothetical protein CVU97_03995 [Firmicutes bacterium HGW-Firmicutes-21]|nr:MAG: hypothetical protein CVU97_03995 [Firmicutes bacterium HGW-Firmicutes-21]
MKKLLAFLLLISLMFAFIPMTVTASDTMSFYIDGVNCTRWADYTVIYKDIDSTRQNQWGHNIVVDHNGKVTRIISSGDEAGVNLAVPKDGMVVSANGRSVEPLANNISVGDYILYDSFSSRILVSKTSNISYFFNVSHFISGINAVRYSDTVVVYENKLSTETNIYGYEVVVNDEGIVTANGGNDNIIPEGGFVVSAAGSRTVGFLRMHGILGAKCVLSADKKTVTFIYDSAALRRTSELYIEDLKSKIANAKNEYKFLDYALIDARLSALNKKVTGYDLTKQESRDLVLSEVYDISLLLSENPAVELRSVWYEPKETNAADVKKVVQNLIDSGFNQVCLMTSNGHNTFLPIPSGFPFSQAARFKNFDVLASYIEQCHAVNIEVVLCVPVFYNNSAYLTQSNWVTEANTKASSEAKYFFSPANEEFINYFLKYTAFIVDNYDIDGFQLDYIRYPYCDGKIDYGYDESTKELFAKKFGVPASVVDQIGVQLSSHAMWNDWVAFKTELITSAVKKISDLIRERAPDLIISADVGADTVPHYYMQDSKSWVDAGLIDALYPMTYGVGYMSEMTEKFAGYTGDDAFLYMGIGVYLGLSDDEILAQIEQSRANGADGACFFELGYSLAQNGTALLKRSAYSAPALSPTYDSIAALTAQLDYSVNRIEKIIVPLGGMSSEDTKELISLIKNVMDGINETNSISRINTLINRAVMLPKKNLSYNVIIKDLKKAQRIALLSNAKNETITPEPNDNSEDTSSTESDDTLSADQTISSDSQNRSSLSGGSSQRSDAKDVSVNSKKPFVFIVLFALIAVGAGVFLLYRRKKMS